MKTYDDNLTGLTQEEVQKRHKKYGYNELNEKETLPTFGITPYKPRWIWWELDLHVIRNAYFSLMMKGMM